LIVISKDPGELALAMSFLQGQDLVQGTRMLLPVVPDVSEVPLPVPTSFYATLADIEAAVDAFAPDVVLLLSAYWFRFDKVASPSELGAFLDRLRTRGRRIVTSDPFLGLASQLTLDRIDPAMVALDHPAVTRWIMRMMIRLQGSRTRLVPMPDLHGVTHLYPVAAPRLDDGVARVVFYNPTFHRHAPPPVSGGHATADPEAAPRSQRWVFVVTETDLGCQSALLGLREFMKTTVQMLQYAQQMGRQPTLIAPPAMMRQIGSVASRWGELMGFRPFADVERRLLDAEYAFFWDAFSAFQLPRLAVGRPVFPFDRGYLARVVGPYHEAARDCWFGGWEPRYLDPRQMFSPYVLAHLAKTQVDALATLRERWQAAPTPDDVVRGLLT
jgi:hypothetical protein